MVGPSASLFAYLGVLQVIPPPGRVSAPLRLALPRSAADWRPAVVEGLPNHAPPLALSLPGIRLFPSGAPTGSDLDAWRRIACRRSTSRQRRSRRGFYGTVVKDEL